MQARPKPRSSDVKATIAKHVAAIRIAKSPDAIEEAFQAAFDEFGLSDRHLAPVQAAMEARGRELCAAHPRGAFVPTFGPGRVLTVCGETYRVPGGGNNAGVRYAWHHARAWATGLLRERGLSEKAAEDVWRWWSSSPHRALREIDRSNPSDDRVARVTCGRDDPQPKGD
ncbi:hypothetical protein G4G93_03660 [Methylobacterium sp. DB0501]|uniref:hypothetical protein n=1 Tax=Methylobacterium sp. DB0501 TaxID=2709665 RepID=UPI0013EE058B|nr:hypothetical protein [Methylobacterium sp. DB0501]NGM33040.1 hypothetical protein [Methylobacterium sp. DB0501]